MRRNFSLIAGLGAGALLLAGTACRQQGQQQGQEEQQQGQQQQREDQQGTGGAGEQQKQDQQGQMQQGQQQGEQSLTGRVTSVDGDTIRVIDSQRDEVVEIKVPKDAQVMRGGEKIKVDDISEGTEVRASYSMQDGERVAKSVTVTGGGQQQ